LALSDKLVTPGWEVGESPQNVIRKCLGLAGRDIYLYAPLKVFTETPRYEHWSIRWGRRVGRR